MTPANVKLNALGQTLRDVSARYGGIENYLAAAGDLDRAISAFFKEQDLDTLRELNGAVARCYKFRKHLVPSTGTEGGGA